VEVLLLLTRFVSIERYCEVIPKRINHDDHSLVKALRVPTAVDYTSRRKATLEFDRRDGAFGAVFEDEAGQEEAGAEEVNTKRMDDADSLVSVITSN